ncbi:biotin/lipoyl-binding protein [Edaphobacter aggregans]|uniref:biotin/lipoyl-binding protein n=1 Tax=Edaphobacter aggregans TaxID=570835 RepID=UPI000558554D|nr:biotin/lipoyl-binding protein [Edaphobacter aggregans]
MNLSQKFEFRGPLKALLLVASIPLPLCFLAGCRHEAILAADQPVAVRLRAPNHLQEPVSVAASGSVEANLTALTGFQVGGRVARVYVEEGQFVKKGQILAELDVTDYRNAYDSASGQAAAARAAALQAQNGVRTQELEQARVDFERARDEYQRQKYLYTIRACRRWTFTRSRPCTSTPSSVTRWRKRALALKKKTLQLPGSTRQKRTSARPESV